MATKKKMNKPDLIREISEETHIRPEVVSIVLDKFIDISIEEMVNHANFPIRGIFNMSLYEVKGGYIGVNGEPVETQTRIRLKMSKNISVLYKLQQNEFSDSPLFVNRDNWQGALKWALNKRKEKPKQQIIKQGFDVVESTDFNPFLDDDDE